MRDSNLKLILISSTLDCTTFHSVNNVKKGFQKLTGLWLAGEMVDHIGIYGSKVADGLSAFQRQSCYNQALGLKYRFNVASGDPRHPREYNFVNGTQESTNQVYICRQQSFMDYIDGLVQDCSIPSALAISYQYDTGPLHEIWLEGFRLSFFSW